MATYATALKAAEETVQTSILQTHKQELQQYQSRTSQEGAVLMAEAVRCLQQAAAMAR